MFIILMQNFRDFFSNYSCTFNSTLPKVWIQGCNGNVPSTSFMVLLQQKMWCSLLPSFSYLVVLKRRTQWQLVAVAFFTVLEKKKTMIMCYRLFCGVVVVKKAIVTCYHCLLLWWCWSEEGNNNFLLFFSL
jgi:hypothetical protein